VRQKLSQAREEKAPARSRWPEAAKVWLQLPEAGSCTTAEVQAITGQSMQMVEHYAKQVNQKKLAASAILKWENAPRTEFVQRER
jgi:hypothetical protein